MSYLPFARKWRPQTFEEIIGQAHITTILKNAILLNRVHHAYLFAGPRGIGKTSMARIFAKALNCEKGPTITPCNKCNFCEEITNGTSLDIIEIDGASNRGIDEIRNLRETVKFAASKGRYKIYIIDEVHMLTQEAFNALLKTLEEPPPHVKFIFATTEPHRLPPTILSRCQRFDFRRIPARDIANKLKEIAIKENLDVEEGVFLYIAKISDGSMRDAEGILDQVSSFAEGKILLKDVAESLGLVSEETLFKTVEFIIEKDVRGIIHLVGEILNSGKDAKQFLIELLGYFRNLMIIKSGASSEELIDLAEETILSIKKQTDRLSQQDIFYIITLLSNGIKMIRQLLPERIVLEFTMIKIALRDSIISIEEILSRLPELDSSKPGPGLTQGIGHKIIEDKNSSLQPGEPKKVVNPEKDSLRNQSQRFDGPSHREEEVYDIKNRRDISSASEAHLAGKPEDVPGSSKDDFEQKRSPLDISRVKDAWPILVKAMAVKKMSISTYLSEGFPESVNGNTILVGFPKELNFHREVLEEPHNKTPIEAALSQILDANVRLQFILSEERTPQEKDSNSKKATLTIDELKNQEPLIDSALNIFGGKIIRPKGAA